MFEYISKFILGGCILVLATYFSKSRNLFLSGIITVLPLMTLANMTLQMKFMDLKSFHEAQKSGVYGGVGLALFVLCVFLMTYKLKPMSSILLSLIVYIVYILICRISVA